MHSLHYRRACVHMARSVVYDADMCSNGGLFFSTHLNMGHTITPSLSELLAAAFVKINNTI